MKQKKLFTLAMATVMAMSSTMMAFAEDVTVEPASGEIEGSGTLEGFVDKDVFTVTVPTISSVDFKLDPQELLLATGSAATVDGSAMAEGYGANILFADSANYTTKSADITFVNKSTFDVGVKVDVEISGLTAEGKDYEVKLVDDQAKFGTDTAITLGVTPTANTLTGSTAGTGTPGNTYYVVDATAGLNVPAQKVEVTGSLDDVYEVTKDDDGYDYVFKDDVSSVAFNTVTFNLAGKVNTTADWTEFSKDSSAALSVTVKYSVEKYSDNQSSASQTSEPSFTAADTVGVINYSKGTGDGALIAITGIKMKVADGSKSYDVMTAKANYWSAATITENTITLDIADVTQFTSAETCEATITYTVAGEEGTTVTKTAIVNVKTGE